jgi:hypothetical protein
MNKYLYNKQCRKMLQCLIWALHLAGLHHADADRGWSNRFSSYGNETREQRSGSCRGYFAQHVFEIVRAMYKAFLLVTCGRDKKAWICYFAQPKIICF